MKLTCKETGEKLKNKRKMSTAAIFLTDFPFLFFINEISETRNKLYSFTQTRYKFLLIYC